MQKVRKARGHRIRLSVRPSVPRQVVGTLCMQLLLQFYSDSFETDQVFRSWSENVHFFGYNPQIIFCHFSYKMNLVIFSAEVNRY